MPEKKTLRVFISERPWIAIIIVVLTIVLINFQTWRKIDTTIQGVEFRLGDSKYSDDVTVTIKGTYRWYLFKENTFDGLIVIDKYSNLMPDASLKGFSFMPINLEEARTGGALLYYQTLKGDTVQIECFGNLFASIDFSEFLIIVREPIESDSKGWREDNGLVIAAPASNKAEAIDMAQKVCVRTALRDVIWE